MMHGAGAQRPGKDSHKGSSQWEKHVQMITQMQAMRVPISAAQYTAAIKACCKLLRPEDALALWHSLKDSGAAALVGTYACVMSGFIKTKQWESALELYINISSEPFDANIIIYNAAISAATNRAHSDSNRTPSSVREGPLAVRHGPPAVRHGPPAGNRSMPVSRPGRPWDRPVGGASGRVGRTLTQ